MQTEKLITNQGVVVKTLLTRGNLPTMVRTGLVVGALHLCRRGIILAALGVASLAQAEPAPYVWLSDSDAARFTGDSTYSFSPAGDVRIVRQARGRYTVSFPGYSANPVNPQVGVYGDDGLCIIERWRSNSTVHVKCFNTAGEPDDRRFLASLISFNSEPRHDFIWASDADGSAYDVPSSYSNAPEGEAVRITRTDTGQYQVRFPFLAGIPEGGSVQISAYGNQARHCNARQWQSDSQGLSVEVRCYNLSGGPADSQFNLAVPRAENNSQSGYVTTQSATDSHSVSNGYARVPGGGSVEVQRSGTGLYTVSMPTLASSNFGGTALVTAVSNSAHQCHIQSFNSGRSGMLARVRCLGADSRPSDSRFSLSMTQKPIIVQPVVSSLIDFEQVAGRPSVQDQLIQRELRESGVVFPDGVFIRKCGVRANTCDTGAVGDSTIVGPRQTEFTARPISIRFTQRQHTVSVQVRDPGNSPLDREVTLLAKSENGNTVGSSAVTIGNRGRSWTRLSVAADSDVIESVQITSNPTGRQADNIFLLDALEFERSSDVAVVDTDVVNPVLTVANPNGGNAIEGSYVSIEYSARDDNLQSVEFRWVNSAGEVVRDYDGPSLCGPRAALPCPSRIDHSRFDLARNYDNYGTYTISIRACDVSGNCVEQSRTVEFRSAPDDPETDVWIMGLEYNQQYQDRVYTDLTRGAEAGFVPLSQPSGNSSEFSIPIVPGKPMLVRVYAGIRSGHATDDEPVPVSGFLTVTSGIVGDIPRRFRPVENDQCQDHLGRTVEQACRRVIDVYPSLGMLGYTSGTRSNLDIDLVQARSHWEGTLNFVLPASYTATLTDGAIFRAVIDPVGHTDISPADNQFELQVGSSRQRDANLRLVLVDIPSAPGPTEEQARRIIDGVKTVLPYSNISISSIERMSFIDTPRTVSLEILGRRFELQTT